jgi:hypothetical protein
LRLTVIGAAHLFVAALRHSDYAGSTSSRPDPEYNFAAHWTSVAVDAPCRNGDAGGPVDEASLT